MNYYFAATRNGGLARVVRKGSWVVRLYKGTVRNLSHSTVSVATSTFSQALFLLCK